ncbi:MAG: hypothetical protein HYY16_19605 [Planctomycetes bacterium]|nr:hypothetical protein [Planctomycetota bacterium]
MGDAGTSAKAEEALREIVAETRERSLSVRVGAAHSLAEGGRDVSPDLFFEGMRRKGFNHALASDGLARLGRKDAIALIVKRMEDGDESLAGYLAEALKRLTGQEIGPDPAAWRAWLEANRGSLPPQVE